jgi:hypothetical protein
VGFVWATGRWFVTFGAMLLTGLAIATNGCDEDQAPELERCTSFLGNPTYDWSFMAPALIAIGVGAVVYGLLSLLGRFWRAQQAALDAAARAEARPRFR